MQTSRGRLLAGLLALAFTTLPECGLNAQAPKPEAEQPSVKVVTYDELGKIVTGFKGKVVVVDFWSTT
jgi:hypothetical protein